MAVRVARRAAAFGVAEPGVESRRLEGVGAQRHPDVPLDAEDWDRLPDRFGFDPAQEAEWRDLLAALRRAVDEELTARQRRVFVAIVLNGVPLDALVIELASNRNAIYKMLFDARRKLRAALAANGYLSDEC